MTHQVASQRASKAQAEDIKRKRREEQEGNVARKVKLRERSSGVQCASTYACMLCILCWPFCTPVFLTTDLVHVFSLCSSLIAPPPSFFILIRPPLKKKSAPRNARGARLEWPQQPRLRKKKERAARKEEEKVEERKTKKEAMRNRSPHIEKHFGARLCSQLVHLLSEILHM